MNIEKSEYYENELGNLNQRYSMILDEYVKNYPKYKTYPKVSRYSDEIAKDKSNMQDIQIDFFSLRDKLELNIVELGRRIQLTDRKINRLEKENDVMLKELDGIESNKDAAVGMFDDIQLRYNQYLLGNYIIIFVLIGSGYIYYRSRK